MAVNPPNSAMMSVLGSVSGAGVSASCTAVLCTAATCSDAVMASPPAMFDVPLVEVSDCIALLCTVATIFNSAMMPTTSNCRLLWCDSFMHSGWCAAAILLTLP